MVIYISFCPIGVFAFDEKDRLLANILFANAKEAARAMTDCRKTRLSEEEEKLIAKLPAKEKIIFEAKKEGYEHVFPNGAGEVLRNQMEKIALETRSVKTKEELRKFVYDLNVELTKQKLKIIVGPDILIIQAVGALEESEKDINTAEMRLREWAGWWLPETTQKITDPKELARVVRERQNEDELSPKVSAEDIAAIRTQADFVLGQAFSKEKIESYIEKRMKDIAPNTAEVTGSILAARLMAAAGSLNALARMPSSTIQILGAEKALFRYLRAGKKGKAPKHGLIFSHSSIQKAQADKKGQAARQLAAKISLAARKDFYKTKPVVERSED